MILLFCALAAAADPIDEIRQRWAETQARREGGHLYPLEIDGNPTGRMYAAIGTYQNRVTCYRDTPPEQPYPADAPVLVTVQHEIAARQHSSMFLFSDTGQLQFAFYEGAEHPTLRVYWQGDRIVRVQQGEAVLEPGAYPPGAAALGENGRGLHGMCAAVAGQEARWRSLED